MKKTCLFTATSNTHPIYYHQIINKKLKLVSVCCIQFGVLYLVVNKICGYIKGLHFKREDLEKISLYCSQGKIFAY